MTTAQHIAAIIAALGGAYTVGAMRPDLLEHLQPTMKGKTDDH